MLRTDALPSLTFLPPPFADCEHANGDAREVVELPRYSSQPSADEETVAYTPRGLVTLPQGTFVKEFLQAKLVLMDQEDGAGIPSYGRYGQVIGELELKDTTGIVNVTAKLTGQLNISSPETGHFKFDFLSDTQMVWKQGDNKDEGCPSILPIFFQIPVKYEAEGRQWHLPPSLDVTLPRVPILVQVFYTLSLTITKLKLWGQWMRNEELSIPLEYYPRTRPVRPVVMYGTVLDSIKTAADEWTEIIDRMDVRPKFQTTMSAIDCQIFIPSIQTFGISDTIPFHLQLIGSIVSLRELLPSSSPLLLPCDETQIGKEDKQAVTIQVRISRQITIEVNGRRKAHTITIGEGRLWPVPPCPSQLQKSGDWEDISLDWQGEVKCGSQVRFGGFLSSHVSIKDSVVFSLAPCKPRSSFLVPLLVSHAIKLVTDGWTDEGSLHPLDR